MEIQIGLPYYFIGLKERSFVMNFNPLFKAFQLENSAINKKISINIYVLCIIIEPDEKII